MLGFIGLPISIALYWLVLRPKRQSPFPKTGLIRLAIAAVISVALSTLLMCFRSSEFNHIVQSTFGDRLEVPAHLRSHPGRGFCERQEPAFGIRPCFILFKKFSKKTVSH